MKTLIVTGGSQGIGYQIALLALAADYRVVNISRSAANVPGIENYAIDLAGPDAERQVQALIASEISSSEICLVHNAAQLRSDTSDNTPTGSFVDILNINLVAPHILNQAVIPRMQAGSSIIYIGSTLSEKAVANTYSYVVTKHAILGMMRATCQDLHGKSIHTACICPGFTDTEMLRKHLGNDARVLVDIAARSAFGRLVTPQEIASCVMFAAAQTTINGAVLHANLGQIER